MYRGLHRYQKAGLVNIDPENTLDGEQVYEAPYSLPEVVISDKLDRTDPTAVRNWSRENDPIAYAARGATGNVAEALRTPLEFAPGTGDVMDAAMLLEALDKRDYGTLGMAGLAAALPGVTMGGLKAGKKLINKFRGRGKEVLEKANLLQPRLTSDGRPLTQDEIYDNINRNTREIEDQISRDRMLAEQEIDRIADESTAAEGYITEEARAAIDDINRNEDIRADRLRELVDAGGIQIQRGAPPGILPESVSRKLPADIAASNTDIITRLERNPQGDFEPVMFTTDNFLGAQRNRNSELFRDASTVRQFDGPFGKETTRIDNPFSGESMRYKDLETPLDQRPKTLKDKIKDRVEGIVDNLKDRRATLDIDLQTGRYSPRSLYRSAQEKGSHIGDVSHSYVKKSEFKTPKDPTGTIGAALHLKNIINDVTKNPGARFQERSLSTDSYPFMIDKLNKKNTKDLVDIKFSGKWNELNFLGDKMKWDTRTRSYQPGYSPKGEDVVDADGVVKTYGADATLEMINKKIAELNKTHGSKIPNAKIVETPYGKRVYAPTIFADSKITTPGIKGMMEKGDSWVRRNPKNIKRAAVGLGAGSSALGSAAIHRYANRNEDE